MILIIPSVKYVQLLSGYFTQIYSGCGCLTFCNIKTTKHSQHYVTKTLLYITAVCCGWVCRTFRIFYRLIATAELVYTK